MNAPGRAIHATVCQAAGALGPGGRSMPSIVRKRRGLASWPCPSRSPLFIADEAGLDTAHIAGNSLGAFVALQLAARGRARSVVALAPAGGWAEGDDSYKQTLAYFASTQEALERVAPHAD